MLGTTGIKTGPRDKGHRHPIWSGVVRDGPLRGGNLEWRQALRISGIFQAVCTFSVIQSCLTLSNPMDYSPLGFSVQGFSRQEYWSGLPFPSPGDLPDPGIEPWSPALQVDCIPLSNLDG